MDALEQACAQAGELGRIVVADFFAEWCDPCRRLDETTWKDPKVLAWLDARAVFVKVDADKEAAAAERLRVLSLPTVLLLRPDGSELDRLVGFRSAGRFLTEAESALGGKDSAARAREALEASGGDDPVRRMDYARCLANKGLYEQALSEYLRCYDCGPRDDPAWFGRLLGLMQDIAALGRCHEPALQALRERRDRAAREAGALRAVEFAALNKTLGEERLTLEAFDKSSDPALRSALFRMVRGLLVQERRYEDLLAQTGDVLEELDESIGSALADMDRDPEDDMLRTAARGRVLRQAAILYEACLGSGRNDDARAVASKLLAFESAGQPFVSLILAARRAGADLAAEELARRAYRELAPDDQILVRQALLDPGL